MLREPPAGLRSHPLTGKASGRPLRELHGRPHPFHDRDGLHLARRQARPMARREDPRADPRACTMAAAVFEGERAYGGEIFKLHRAQRAAGRERARMLGFRNPLFGRRDRQACRDVVAANKLSDCYVRPIAWRGSEQMGVSAQATKIHMSRSPPGTGAPISRWSSAQRASASRMPKYRRPDPA